MAILQVTNLCQLLQRAAIFDTGITIYPAGHVHNPTRISYNDLFLAAKQNAILLRQSPITAKKEIIFLHFDNHTDSIQWLWASLIGGYVPVISTPLPIDHGQREKHLLHLHSTLNHPVMLTTVQLIPDFLGIETLHLHSTEDIQNHESPYPTKVLPGRAWYSWLMGRVPRLFSKAQLGQEDHAMSPRGFEARPDDLAVLMLTSGSTGLAKAVCLTHGQILKAVEGKSRYHKTAQDTNFLNWIGMDHVANLTEIHLHAMYLGSNQVHVHAADLLINPATFLNLSSMHQIGYTFAPNFFLGSLKKCLDYEGSLVTEKEGFRLDSEVDLSKLKAFISGGEANVVETCDALTRGLTRFNVQGDVLRPGFGMTETCAGSIYGTACPSYELALGLEFASVGSCIPGMHMRIMSDNGSETAREEIGNLHVEGDVVFQRYYNNKAATADAFTEDGWFITGDRAYIDAAGNLNLAGRAKESIIINGVSVYPHQLESAIEDANLAGVTPSYIAVFSHRPPKSDTDCFCVVYLPRYGRDDIIMRVETDEGVTKVSTIIFGARPFAVIPVERSHLPKTSLGKLSRSKIQKAFEAGSYQELQNCNLDAIKSHMSHRQTNRQLTDMENIVFSSFVEVLGFTAEEIGINSNLFEVGITSIDLLRLKSVLQKKLALADIPLITILSNPSAEEMARALEQLRPGEGQNHPSPYNPVVALATKGSRTPLWLVHPGVGEILVFLNLAKLTTDRPVYALRARGFERDENFFSSIPEIVGIYIQHIKRTQPNGPYAIAGYSFGAMLAFEISKRLEAQGDEVRFLASFNLPPHIKTRMQELNWTEVALNLGCFLDFYTEDYAHQISPTLHQKPHADVLSHIMQRAPTTRLTELSLTPEKLSRWISLAHAMQNASRDYDPSGSVANIDVFYCTPLASVARDRGQWLREHLSKWKDFSRCAPKFHEVQGAHYTMLDPQNVVSFQKKLQSVLSERGV